MCETYITHPIILKTGFGYQNVIRGLEIICLSSIPEDFQKHTKQ